MFEGSTGDPATVAAQVDKIRGRFGLQRVVLVGDRGMLTGARIREDLKGIDGMRWITTLRAPTIRKLIANGKVAQWRERPDPVDLISTVSVLYHDYGHHPKTAAPAPVDTRR